MAQNGKRRFRNDARFLANEMSVIGLSLFDCTRQPILFPPSERRETVLASTSKLSAMVSRRISSSISSPGATSNESNGTQRLTDHVSIVDEYLMFVWLKAFLFPFCFELTELYRFFGSFWKAICIGKAEALCRRKSEAKIKHVFIVTRKCWNTKDALRLDRGLLWPHWVARQSVLMTFAAQKKVQVLQVCASILCIAVNTAFLPFQASSLNHP